ncbi:carbon-nitrogen hydrolase family protein [Halomarina oriensis]|nr:carbon-nitrogen hydrolase family protein [Halomarina oriensis]
MRPTRVLSIALHNPTDSDDPAERVRINLDNITALLERAATFDPDFVCLPEAALQHASNHLLDDVAQPIPGPATEVIGEHARALDSYVLLPMYERDGDSFYNATALVDPSGEVIGTYRKLAPTLGEMAAGITPGEEVPVWDTPFGRVGILICWDARYAEVGTELGAKGANLVFFPTHGTTHNQLRTWAQYHGYHVVSCDKNDAKVYTPRREVTAEVGDNWKNPEVEDIDLHGGRAWLSFAELNTDMKSYAKASDTVWTWGKEVQRKYGGSVVLDVAPGDGVFVLESIDEDVSLADIEADLEMETTRGYEDRTRARIHETIEDSPLRRLDEWPDV